LATLFEAVFANIILNFLVDDKLASIASRKVKSLELATSNDVKPGPEPQGAAYFLLLEQEPHRMHKFV
jgi:hypothetical protein